MKQMLTMVMALVLCLTLLTAGAEWQPTPLVYVTDPALVQELTDYAHRELARLFPGLTEEQRARFAVDTLVEYEWCGGLKVGMDYVSGWKMAITYDDCYPMMMDFEVIRTEDGTLETVWVLPWDLEALVNLYDSSITYEEALAVGRISMGAAMAAEAAEFPDRALAAVDRCGLAMLDPSGFVVEAAFVSPLNGGIKDEPAHWSLSFALPVDPAAGANWDVNPLWYQVDVNAATGAVMDETAFRLFSVYQLED